MTATELGSHQFHTPTSCSCSYEPHHPPLSSINNTATSYHELNPAQKAAKSSPQSLFTLLLVSFAMAEETLFATAHGNTWKYGTSGGVLGFIVLILVILVFRTSSSPFHFRHLNNLVPAGNPIVPPSRESFTPHDESFE